MLQVVLGLRNTLKFNFIDWSPFFFCNLPQYVKNLHFTMYFEKFRLSDCILDFWAHKKNVGWVFFFFWVWLFSKKLYKKFTLIENCTEIYVSDWKISEESKNRYLFCNIPYPDGRIVKLAYFKPQISLNVEDKISYLHGRRKLWKI